MKPIFCTDITVNRNNTEINGSEFIKKSISEEKRAEMDSRARELQDIINKAKAPGWMVTARSISGFSALIMAMNLIQVALEKGFSALFAADQIMGTMICLGAAAAWMYLDRDGKARVRKLENDPQLKRKNDEIEIEIAMIMHEMGVPTNAKSLDVLVFNYKTKDGEIAPVSSAMLPSTMMNIECKAYADEDAVYIADGDSVYAFQKSEIKSLRKMDGKVNVYGWNKSDAPSDPKYAAYGVSFNKLGMVTTFSYVVEIERDGETFGLYLPGYEADVLSDIFGFDNAIDAKGDMIPLPKYEEDADLDEEDCNDLSAEDADEPEAASEGGESDSGDFCEKADVSENDEAEKLTPKDEENDEVDEAAADEPEESEESDEDEKEEK